MKNERGQGDPPGRVHRRTRLRAEGPRRGNPGPFRPGTPHGSLDLRHRDGRRLHRRRLGRRRLVAAGARCAISATSSACASSPWRPSRASSIRGEELPRVSHAYGTNGIITEIETAARPGLRLGPRLRRLQEFPRRRPVRLGPSNEDGILIKLASVYEAPMAHSYFQREKTTSRPRTRPRRPDGRPARHGRLPHLHRPPPAGAKSSSAPTPTTGRATPARLRIRLEPHHPARPALQSGDHLPAGPLPLPRPPRTGGKGPTPSSGRGRSSISKSCARTAR